MITSTFHHSPLSKRRNHGRSGSVAKIKITANSMKRNNELLEKRRLFILDYLKKNEHKQIKVVVQELSEILFITTRTIYLAIEK